MKRSIKRLSRFSLRSLILLVALVALMCWFLPRWGAVLVTVGADRVLVPLGIATYGHNLSDTWIIREIETSAEANGHADKAVWVSKENCNRCHTETKGWIAFPVPDSNTIIVDEFHSQTSATNEIEFPVVAARIPILNATEPWDARAGLDGAFPTVQLSARPR